MEGQEAGIREIISSSFLTGLAVGLAICIVMTAIVVVTDNYYTVQKYEEIQESLDAEFQTKRLQMEGYE